ncbi:MAG TPA: DUF1653 domain-containing protein [Thermoanaerobaculia bacterium]|jgi:hypothetical protein|nr:DUF1653 domain-containing protein [Thermoanaerobaculia bacterium]
MTDEKDPKDEAQEKLAAEKFPLGLYRHYKGPSYKAFAVSIDEGTLEPLVHYVSLAHGTTWTRTVKNFTEGVEVRPGVIEPRFSFVVPTNTWMNSPQYLAQIGHFLGGASIMILATIFFGFVAWWIAFAAVAVAAAIKEFWYDARYELPKQTFGDNLMDFAFYALGSGAGAGVMWLAHHLHRIG